MIIINLLLFFYCISFGFWFLGGALGLQAIKDISINFNTEQARLGTIANSTGTQASFTAANPFGDFITGINIFWQFISGGVIWHVLNQLMSNGGQSTAASQAFIIPMQVVTTALTALGLWYIVTGRGTEIST